MPKASPARKQLNVRSDVAYRLAHEMARREGRSTQSVVEAALIAYAERAGAGETAREAETQAALEYLRDMSASTRHLILPGATSDHSEFYDEFGLPK
jgi:hypothetical protein